MEEQTTWQPRIGMKFRIDKVNSQSGKLGPLIVEGAIMGVIKINGDRGFWCKSLAPSETLKKSSGMNLFWLNFLGDHIAYNAHVELTITWFFPKPKSRNDYLFWNVH